MTNTRFHAVNLCCTHTCVMCMCTRVREKHPTRARGKREKKRIPIPAVTCEQDEKSKKNVPFKGNLATSKILFNCFITLQGGIFSFVRPTAFRTMALLCVLFIFYVHNEQSAICIYSQFQSRLPTFICCSLYSSYSTSTSFWLCVILKTRVLLFRAPELRSLEL